MADFIQLAESSRWVLNRILSSSSSTETDDFVNLATTTATTTMGGGRSDSVYNDGNRAYDAATTTTSLPPPPPFLSKSAEAELYLLGTFVPVLACALLLFPSLVSPRSRFPFSLSFFLSLSLSFVIK